MINYDKEFNDLYIYLDHHILLFKLNLSIDKSKVSKHRLISFKEFKNTIYDPWTGETSINRYKKVFNIKKLFNDNNS